MDVCGAIAARRFARRQVVTASMEGVDFLASVDLGEVVTVTSYVFETRTTSIEVKVGVHAERPRDERRRWAATSLFTSSRSTPRER